MVIKMNNNKAVKKTLTVKDQILIPWNYTELKQQRCLTIVSL